MTDSEIREILSAILEQLKTQTVYVRNLHESIAALFDALKRDHPQLEENHRAEMEKIRLNPVQQSQLDAVDALLRRLRTP